MITVRGASTIAVRVKREGNSSRTSLPVPVARIAMFESAKQSAPTTSHTAQSPQRCNPFRNDMKAQTRRCAEKFSESAALV
jgi:hypothetical protein